MAKTMGLASGHRILCISSKGLMVQSGGQGNGDVLDGLFSTKRERVEEGKGMQFRCFSSGSITTVPGAAMSCSLDHAATVRSKDDGSKRRVNINFQVVEVVQ